MDAVVKPRRRWGDNDRHFGPLTFAYRERWRPFAIVLTSGSTERENPGCCIRFQAFGATMICELPAIIKPWRKWVDLSDKEWAKNGGYWDEHPREYGFCLSDGHLSVKLGAQTHDSTTTQDWGCFLPWTQWRHVAHRIYNADGSFVGNADSVKLGERLKWDERAKLIDSATKAHFSIIDYDGEQIAVETYIEEREWWFGTGWFRWLAYFRPRKIRRDLNLSFASEVGPEKGSWKGGMVGHSADMMPGDTPETAFRRYCEQEHRSKSGRYRIKFVEPSATAQ